ncbi:GGDEF domain-containing protein [Spongiibacter sp. KMU-158]|uniref:diguanylate cyclase n=1 Tax=Spongiibacter pelagi TaxID=2760804 RepID=A0A927BZU6_9GAMM|nr:GGDEF domain-containing protein [Spongiibacter pelagi]
MRQTDIVARTGGEEFVVVMQHSNQAECAKRIDALRQQFNETPILLDGETVTVSFSAGVAGLDESDENLDSLLNVADRRLYKAKDQGRNQVVSSSD